MSSFASSSNFEQKNMVRIALCQVNVGSVKATNIEHIKSKISDAKNGGAKLVILPECWNSPYSTASFPEYAEIVPAVGNTPCVEISPSTHMLCSIAKQLELWIIGGSIPEREVVNGEGRLYNTCIIANSMGEIVGKHRKIHLFDIDVPGKIKFKESDSLSPGVSPTIVNTPWGLIGVGICYDVRFPELAILMRKQGCNLFVYPGAFNMVTGPAHWELLMRARAVDNQVFVACCSPARIPEAGYVAWGHSMVVSPWGEVLASASKGEEIVFNDLDMSQIESIRQSVPCWTQKRFDVYTEVSSPPSTSSHL
mmetsp:Transcript_26022/g.26232  ORF Transcript_26022/g.26232 Transcript_26022/m.26232 type:complete len:309 (-) Transcript_26022:179-1105(-)